MYDVVIVGGSFSGLFLSSLLAKKHKVCVIEKSKGIEDHLLSTGSTFLLEGNNDIFSLFALPKNSIINSYNSITLKSKTEHAYSVFKRDIWCLLDTRKFKRNLINRRIHYYFGWEAKELVPGADIFRSVIITKNGQTKKISGKIFVDATGSDSALTSQTSIKQPKHTSQCYQIDCDIHPRINSKTVQLFIGDDFCPGGYGYMFPISSTRVRMGICGTEYYSGKPIDIEENFKLFLSKQKFKISKGTNILKREAYTGGYISKNYYKNLIGIGDSVGHLSPVMGEGIRFGLHAGKIASTLIEEYLNGNQNAFHEFNTLWKKEFKFLFLYAYIFQQIIARLPPSAIDTVTSKTRLQLLNEPEFLLNILSTNFTLRDLFTLGRWLL